MQLLEGRFEFNLLDTARIISSVPIGNFKLILEAFLNVVFYFSDVVGGLSGGREEEVDEAAGRDVEGLARGACTPCRGDYHMRKISSLGLIKITLRIIQAILIRINFYGG